MDPWTTPPVVMKAKLRQECQTGVPQNDQWRLSYLQKLLNARIEAYFNCDDEQEEILSKLIESLIKN